MLAVSEGFTREGDAMTVLEFSTPRCRVDRVLPEDQVAIVALYLDPAVRRYLGGPSSPERAAEGANAAMQDKDRSCARAVRLVGEENLAGLLFLGPHHDGIDIEVSYCFAPTYWGKGIASEAVSGLMQRVNRDLGLRRVVAETQKDNEASRKLLETVGMRPIRELVRFGAPQIIYAIEV
ncbi:GNAT family N-acetyltransferase [Sulfitobacter sp. S223]|uniref:GNAT family N-acetyltransferase n=1 Tax=Sulfitobacter sp. S223 TaxID=2867023 RepID=UPI0021A283B4|nr:GNAT family N-acetyltransferase [Sulfitobacter sp. S223]UWR25078.1 GNAT family N-acetyltransferase [Sulfitobacter sp. S223]